MIPKSSSSSKMNPQNHKTTKESFRVNSYSLPKYRNKIPTVLPLAMCPKTKKYLWSASSILKIFSSRYNTTSASTPFLPLPSIWLAVASKAVKESIATKLYPSSGRQTSKQLVDNWYRNWIRGRRQAQNSYWNKTTIWNLNWVWLRGNLHNWKQNSRVNKEISLTWPRSYRDWKNKLFRLTHPPSNPHPITTPNKFAEALSTSKTLPQLNRNFSAVSSALRTIRFTANSFPTSQPSSTKFCNKK